MIQKKQRILGFDFARGLAIIGMVIINFKIVMAEASDAPLYHFVNLLSGKAASLFVVLAGVGMTLMYEGAKRKNDPAKIKKVKTDLLKRSLFLFVVGLSYYVVWPADILHYYGVYMVIGTLLLSASTRLLQLLSLILIFGFSGMLLVFNYETGWNWETLEYTDFFTLNGFFRHLFFNGFHPLIPWLAFLLTGIWVGRIDFTDSKKHRKVTLVSLVIYLTAQGLSSVLIAATKSLPKVEAEQLNSLFWTEPMPPTLFYMISAASLATFIICISIYIGKRFPNALMVKQLVSAGQLALSNYFFHVIIGMLGLYVFVDKLEQSFSIEFTFLYALVFNGLLIVFSHLWRKKFDRGPLEWVMRKITG